MAIEKNDLVFIKRVNTEKECVKQKVENIAKSVWLTPIDTKL